MAYLKPTDLIKKGDKVVIMVEVTIIDTSNSHGLCFEVLLPQMDFREPRKVWIDEKELFDYPGLE